MTLALFMAGTAWFVQLCMMWGTSFLTKKKSDYLLFMTIRGEQREDVDVERLVKAFKKEYNLWMLVTFLATAVHFIIVLLPFSVDSLQMLYFCIWCTVAILGDFMVTQKYTNRMYELKLSKGWGKTSTQSPVQVDTVVSRMKKQLPVSEIWLALPAWICIGSFLWWFLNATEYKMLLFMPVVNLLSFVFFCYLYHRMAHGKLKVYSEDSDINYALNRTAKRAWTGCIVWEATLLCGYQFLMTVWMHSLMKEIAAGTEKTGAGFLVGISVVSVLLLAVLVAVFYHAANQVKNAKKALAGAADLSYAEDEDACWRNGYYYNPNDTSSFVENRGAIGLSPNMATKWGPITKWILIGTLVVCLGLSLGLLPFDFGKITMQTNAEGITLKGCIYYTEELAYTDVAEVVLLTEKPECSRVWGTGSERFSLGEYHFDDYGNGKAMIDKEADYYLMVKRENGKWLVFSVKDSETMLRCYERLQKEVE